MRIAIAIFLLLSFCGVNCELAQAGQPLAKTCAQLGQTDLGQIEGAPAQITDARAIAASKALPDRCELRGYVEPNVGFLLSLPTTGWNGKFLQVGCGGDCGDFFWKIWCHLPEGYACLVSDLGHQGGGGLWASHNLQALIDYGYRGTHVTAIVGKALVAQAYAVAPRRSYFLGCSDGGRQGLVEAQRFPWDFDGIVSGAPDISGASEMQIAWAIRTLRDSTGKPVLTRADAQTLHEAVLQACDRADGPEDGLIESPKHCRFDPSVLACSAQNARGCLNPNQVDAIRRVYAGPTTAVAGYTYLGGANKGSELQWIDDGGGYVISDGTPSRLETWTQSYFRYLIQPSFGPRWTINQFDADQDFKRIDGGIQTAILSAGNPDLRRFKANGGKLLLYHGWNDLSDLPRMTIDYYESVEKTMGGSDATRSFARLFMIPGMRHCGGGEGASDIDYLAYLDQWVEKKQAPDRLVGSHLDQDSLEFLIANIDRDDLGEAYADFEARSKQVRFARSIFPYPALARYRGSGSPLDANNFREQMPSKVRP